MNKNYDSQQDRQDSGGGSLENFSFDTDENWFDIDGKDDGEDVITAVKKSSKKDESAIREGVEDGDDDDDFPKGNKPTTTVTKPVTKPKPESKPEPKERELDEEDEDEEDVKKETFFGLDDDGEEETTKKKPQEVKKPATKKDRDDEELENVVERKTPRKEREEVEDDDTKFYTTLAKEMADKGMFKHVEFKDNEEIDEDRFLELQGEEMELGSKEIVKNVFQGMSPKAIKFFEFLKAGGKEDVFFSVYEGSINLDEFDEDKPAQVERVLTHYLATVEELDAEEIKDKLEWLKEGGKEKIYAKKYFNKLKKDEEEVAEALLQQAKAKRNKEIDDNNKFDISLREILSNTTVVGAVPINSKDQKELAAYINKPVIKVGKNRFVSQLEADLSKILAGKTKEDKQKLLALSKMIRSDFKPKDLVTETTSKVVNKVKSGIKAAKEGGRRISSGYVTSRGLADDFD